MNKKNKRYPVNKNEYYEAEVQDLSYQGMGVVKIDNYPLFVEGALPGEIVGLKVIKTNKNFGFGRLINLIEKSPDRVEIEEDVYSKTGTMPLQHMSYQAQLDFKRQQVVNNLQRTAGLSNILVHETIGMDHPYAYRNKAQIPVQTLDGELTTGTYRQRSHELVPLKDFRIQDPEIDQAILVVRDILREYDITAYNEETLKGLIRHLIVRRGHYTGELMVVLVTNGQNLPHEEEIVSAIVEALPETVSIIQNINEKDTNVILGRKSKILYGEDKYQDQLFDFTFEISHQSFYQVNSEQTEILYQIALDYADLSGQERVIDAYCGIGTLTLTLASQAKEVYGIEIVPPAIENAKRNATINGVDNAHFTVGAAEKVMPDWVKEGMDLDVIVVDPPRKGLDQDFLDAVISVEPDRFVYVSCNPATLARDVKYLLDHGYQAVEAQPVDMFPQTTHVEAVVKLVRDDSGINQ